MEIFSVPSVRSDSISEYAAWRFSSAYGSRLVVFGELGCKGSLYTLLFAASSKYASLFVRPFSRAYSVTLLPLAPQRLQRY